MPPEQVLRYREAVEAAAALVVYRRPGRRVGASRPDGRRLLAGGRAAVVVVLVAVLGRGGSVVTPLARVRPRHVTPCGGEGPALGERPEERVLRRARLAPEAPPGHPRQGDAPAYYLPA